MQHHSILARPAIARSPLNHPLCHRPASTARLASLPIVCLALASTAMAAAVDATFTSAATVPVTAASYTATGNQVNLKLAFAPPVGTSLTVVNHTGLDFISGRFDNLAQGQVVTLIYKEAYRFVANYYGGTGNDLVLHWADNKAYGWGNNSQGQLGCGNTAVVRSPVSVTRTGVLDNKTLVAVSAGFDFSLALCADGTVASWGDNSHGQLGNNSTTPSSVPVDITRSGVLADKTVVAVSAGYQHALALCSDGTVASWGDNGHGQLGNGSHSAGLAPVAVTTSGALAGRAVVAISAGSHFSLALCADGAPVSWGINGNGQLGNGQPGIESNVPINVTSTGALAGKTVTAISAGGMHALAHCSDGTLVAWGSNNYGETGGSTGSEPVEVAPLGALAGKTITRISAGCHHNLALCADGTVAAWGCNSSGQLGDGSYTDRSVPVAVNSGVLRGVPVIEIAAGCLHSTARGRYYPIAAWGSNRLLEYGNNTSVPYGNVPVQVTTSTFARRLAIALMAGHAANHSFALTTVLSSAPALLGLTLNPGVLRPGFSGRTQSYSASVPADTTAVTVKPTAEDGATIRVNGIITPSGAASGPVAVGPGATVISVVVTAEDGIASTSYSISVDNFAPSFSGYEFTTPFETPASIACDKVLANASDQDGDALTIILVGANPVNGSAAVLADSSILYTPAAGFSGSDDFVVLIVDAWGAYCVGLVRVTVGPGPSDGGAGANPPVLTVLPEGKVGLAFQGIPGRSYVVQRSVSGLGSWETLATITADAAGRVSFTDESPPPGSAFYRLGLP